MRKKVIILRNTLIILLAVLIVLFVIDRLFGLTSNYRLTNNTFSSEKLPEEFNDFTIAFISDLNIAEKGDLTRTKKIVKELNKKDVDMVLFGGDIFDKDVFEAEQVSEILKSINSKYGKFAVTGEKDQIDINMCTNILTEGGFEVLHNEIRNIYYNESCINLIGLENNGDCSQLINDSNKDNFKLAIIHQPDYFDEIKKNDVQLQLSGHTMGGYIKLPFIGGLIKKDLGEQYISGRHTSQNTTLIISNGLNKEADENYRIFTSDEINIITLEKNS